MAAALMAGLSLVICLRAEAQNSTQPGTTPQPGTVPAGGPSTITQTPFFSTPDVSRHLNLSNNQAQGLNQAYQNAWTVYKSGINSIDPNWSATKRQQAMQDLQRGFYKNFVTGSNKLLTDPTQRQRLDQLWWQYRGYGAFADPAVAAKLQLTPVQTQKLDQAQLNWMNRMNKLGTTFSTNQDLATQQFNTMQNQRFEQINSILTPEQRSVWEQMSGKPYTFNPRSYYTPSTTAPGTVK